MDAIASQTRKEFRVSVSCKVSGEAFALPASTCRELLFALREAVHNAARHGQPKEIAIDLRYETERVLISVTDDGKGFSVADPPADGHFGITGIRERMDKLGGIFLLSSASGRGTRVELALQRSLFAAQSTNMPTGCS